MPLIEVYAPRGVATGNSSGPSGVDAAGETASALRLEPATWYPLDGGPAVPGGRMVAGDDQLLIASDEPEPVIHATWYPIVLDIGPYRVTGRLGTPPGFDPERALARPSGPFITLREATIELLGRSDGEPATRARVDVNRYAVDRVRASLMLGFFFPGAVVEPGMPVA
jgi:hypothetical protein